MYESRTSAQIYALVIGLLLLSIGVAGFVIWRVNDSIVGPWNSGAYVLGGLLGLATWRRADSARIYAIAIGALYVLLAAWGFAALAGFAKYLYLGLWTSTLAGAIFHLVLCVVSIAIAVTSPRHGRYPIPEAAELA